jgi:hypothetical protein
MGYYRKKPITIEAFKWSGDVYQIEDPEWIVDLIEHGKVTINFPNMFIETLEGIMKADAGDWIIKGVKGEVYPCKPDIFEATYEPATNPET